MGAESGVHARSRRHASCQHSRVVTGLLPMPLPVPRISRHMLQAEKSDCQPNWPPAARATEGRLVVGALLLEAQAKVVGLLGCE